MAAQNTANQIAGVFSNFGERMRPFGQQMGKQFSQFQQYAKERIGSANDITELPVEYRELEEKVDRVRLMLENLAKVGRNFTLPHYDYEPPLKDTVFDFASTVGDRASVLAATSARAVGVPNPMGDQAPAVRRDEIPPSLAHAFSRVAINSAEALGTEEPVGVALRKFSNVEEKVGNARLKMDQEAQRKFYQPIMQLLNVQVTNAMKARRNVQSVRLTYDACRARLKATRPDNVDQTRQEMELAEDEFVAAVDDAMGKMKAVVDTPEPLKCLADLVAAQLAYFKEAYDALAEASPEIDELHVTNEALLRHPTS